MHNRKKMFAILLVLLVLVVGISIAYSTLSKSLTVTYSSVKQVGQTWNVGFDTTTSPVSATTATVSNKDFSCNTATVTATTVTVGNISLSAPGDKCTWPLTIKNNGTIDAYISTFQFVTPNLTCTTDNKYGVAVCDPIKYRITTDADGNNTLSYNTIIRAGASLQVYLSARYNLTDSLGSGGTQTGVQIKAVFTQK